MDRACFQNLSSRTRCTLNNIRTFCLSAVMSIFVMFFLSIATIWAESNPNERYPMLSLTPEEASWLEAQSRIEIGIMDNWPPFDFVSPDGRPRGIGVDFIHALNRRLKRKLVMKPGVWSDIYNQVKEKKLAALMDITPNENRKPYFNFTRPYISVPHVIIAPKKTPFIGSETDLKGKTLALEKGFGNVTYFQTHYPDIQIKEYADTKAALDAVARKEADAYAGNRAVAVYLMEEEVMLNLKVHGPLKKEGSILAMGTRKDWPILRDILQKALDSLSREERHEIIGKWALVGGQSPPKNLFISGAALQIAIIALIFFLISWIIIRQIGRSHTDPLSSAFATGGARRLILILNTLLVAITITLAWWAMDRVKSKIHEGAEKLEVYRTVQWLALPILALVVLLTLAFTILILVIGERANRALMASRDALEERVEERTKALKKLTRATEQSPVSVVITDKEGTIEYVNPTFTRVTGYTFEEAVGQNPRILKSDQHEPEFYQSLWDTILSGNTWTGDIVNLKKNREAFWEQVSIAPLVNENGEITNFVAMKEDISDKKKLLQELMEAKDAAEKANQAKSIFLANMSHEIRTPMNAILGYSQLMQHDERLSQENLKHLDIINRSGDHLLKLINDILEMSKIEAGRIELAPVTFDLHDVILDLELMFRQRADDKGLDFVIDRAPDLPRFIFGDENKIRQVLVNLMGNAVKFTRNGEISLTVKAEADDNHLIHEASKQLVVDNLIVTLAPQRPRRDENGQNDAVGERGQDNGSQGVLIRDEGLTLEDDLERESPEKEGSPPDSATDEIHLIFEVMDTGPGVPEDHHELIFGAFEQSDSGRQAHGGTGLGLAISRKYARMMSGDITIRNRPGFGAVFKFDCLVRQAEPLTRDDDGFEFHSVLHLKDEIPPQKILVVDDRIFNVDLLSKMLIRVGFEVRQAYNGKEAVALFETWQPNAVLMDVRMPVMDGIEATRRIRAYERRLRQKRSDGDTRQSAAIIAVSASSLEYQKKEILQKGLADDFIGKPFKEMEIYKTLEKYLNVTYTYKNRQYANKKDASLNPDNAIATQTVENSLKNDLKENAGQYGDKLTQLDGLQRAFRALPESLSNRLQEAIINLEIDHIRDLTEQIESADKTLASTILKLIESYDFDTLNTISGAKE